MAFLGLLTYCFVLFIRPADWIPAVMGWPIEAVVVSVTLVLGLSKYMSRTAPHRNGLGIMAALLAGWVAVIFLSNAVHGNVDEAYGFARDFAKRGIVLIMFWVVLDSTTKLRWFAVILVMTIALLGWQGIDMVANGVGWAGQPMYWGGRIRWVGMWDGANVLSLVFVTSIPFVLELLFGPWPIIARLLAAGAGALIMTGMGYAASRGAGLALLVVLVLYFGKRLGKTGILIAPVLIVGLLAVAPGRFTHLGTTDGSDDAESSMERIDMWAQGLEMFKYNPVFGIGKGQYAGYTGSLIAHNAFVQNLGETGFVGVMIWLTLIYYPIKRIRAALQSPHLSPKLKSIGRATSSVTPQSAIRM
jgi:putative inorganic carbon (hco3(-)) transporter